MIYEITLLFLGIVIVITLYSLSAVDRKIYEAQSAGFDAGYNCASNRYIAQLSTLKELLVKETENNTNQWAVGYGDASSEILAAMRKYPEEYHKFIDNLSNDTSSLDLHSLLMEKK